MSNNRSKYKKDYTEENKELDKTDEEIQIEKTTPVNDHEDESWKKRYGDLRTYMNTLQQETKKTVEELNSKVKSLSEKDTKIPVNEEEFVEWVETYPKVANIMKVLIKKEAEQINNKINDLESNNNKRSLDLKKQEAKMKLQKAHPDFYESIAGTREFQTWAQTKIDEQKAESNHSWVENALFDPDGTDWKTAADAISLYKSESGYQSNKPNSKADPKDAAREVNTSSSSAPSSKGSGSYEFTESQIQGMSEREYEELEEKIDLAARNGRIKYDLTGGAR